MPSGTVHPPYDQFLLTAEREADARPEVNREMAREVFLEVATVLYDGMALDGLDEHDTAAVIAGLCEELVVEDPAAAVRARSQRVLEAPGDLHDPERVAAAYLVSATMLRL